MLFSGFDILRNAQIRKNYMNSISVHVRRALALLLFVTGANALFAENTLPLITIDGAPLADTIRTLARQSSLNIIIDPRVPGSEFEPGRSATQPTIKMVWTNSTTTAALNSLLKDHKLKIVTSPSTTVNRIVPADAEVEPVPTDKVITKDAKSVPLFALDSAPLTDALNTIARFAGMTITLDEKVSTLDDKGSVSVRWEKITAQQALAALLDNYGLTMDEAGKVTLKTK